MNTNINLISSTFAAFRYRNYRLWFAGQLISLVGSWMQRAALGYLVYTLTGSSAFLGYVALVSGLPSWLFLLYGGVIADRVSRRALMMITQSLLMLLAFGLAGLVLAGAVQPWHILVLSFLSGTASAFETPARQSLVADLVEREHLTNAIALNVTMFNTGMIVGPAVAGVLYAAAGPAWCFLINGVSFLAVILALGLMRSAPRPLAVPPVQASRQSSVLASIWEGIQYVRAHGPVRALMLSAFFYNIYDYAMIIFIPAFAVRLLNGGAETNGLLLTANAAGAVLGGLLLASFASRLGRERIWVVSAYITPLMIAAFTLSRWLPLSLLLTGVIGVTSITVLSNMNSLIQSAVSDELRGRVMSLYSLGLMGGGPLGALLLGQFADRAGVQAIGWACTAMALAFAAWVAGHARAG